MRAPSVRPKRLSRRYADDFLWLFGGFIVVLRIARNRIPTIALHAPNSVGHREVGL